MSRAAGRAALALAVAALGGCRYTTPDIVWTPREKLGFDAARYAGEDGVVLSRRLAFNVSADWGPSYTTVVDQRAVAVLTERGVDAAEIFLSAWRGRVLERFLVRHYTPDGKLLEYGKEDLIVDQASGAGVGADLYAFRVPDVRPGSVLEWGVKWGHRGHTLWDEEGLAGPFPVRRFEYTVRAATGTDIELRLLNIDGQLEARVTPDFTSTWRCVVEDVPASRPEPGVPHWSFEEPLVTWRVRKWVGWDRKKYPALDTWGSAFGWLAESTYARGTWVKGFDPGLDLSACADDACRLERALAEVRRRLPVTSTGRLKGSRPLAEVWDSGGASEVERAVMLQRLLDLAGVPSRLAPVTRGLTRAVDPDFPESGRFDAALVLVEPRGGKPTWVDAGCDFCSPGEVRALFLGRKAVPFRPKAKEREEPKDPERMTAEAELVDVAAKKSEVPDLHGWKKLARLEGDALVFEETEEQQGEAASGTCRGLSWRTRLERLQDERTYLERRWPKAVLGPVMDPWCEPSRARLRVTRQARLPAAVAALGGRRFLPLDFLDSPGDRVLPGGPRAQSYAFGEPMKWVDELVLELPPGAAAQVDLRDETKKTPWVSAEVQVAVRDGALRVRRSLEVTAGIVPPERYAEARAVRELFSSVRRQAVVLAPGK